MKLNKKQKEILQQLNSVEFEYYAPAEVSKLQAEGLVEVNAEMESEGKYATRLTQKGFEVIATPSQAEPAPSFEISIDDNIPMPETVRKSRGSMYPFEQLEIGQSFFVPNKDLRSSTSSHAKREADKGGVKRWICRVVVENGVEGSRVWRIENRKQPENPEAAE